ncbi:MAG: cupin domain-containing protein [Acidobacteria bacterium]|nr:cupin domain-containing protein [Acidobacteriota bacterium]
MLINNNEAKFVGGEQGAAWSVLGEPMLCKVSSEETGGAYSIVENIVPAHDGPPPHVHGGEDEIFYVTEGEFEFMCGGRTFIAKKGDLAVCPRGIPHAFRNITDAPGRLWITLTPGGFEKFFEEVSRDASAMPPDVEKIKAIGRKYNLDFLI